jgi:hypothetical protein
MVAEIETLQSDVKAALLSLASQCNRLGAGLQNIAPPSSEGPSNSVLYLTEIAMHLDLASKKIPPPKW